ncbi:FAD-binding and (Fe-S)-binding domain-containing protein [Hanstruepera flava]|uniref:FAD-binding and (Fe-S)-binding domain-containing protein n=1 Tax=Hanstruepera flava TaxID=2930218 RepID=UPI002028C8F1|nr:FAD-binding and (Fe-S)-binding domain-containing protein [Hanstruepera flava]
MELKYLNKLNELLEGELHFDDLMKTLYATDASVYRMLPLAVAVPKNENDLKCLIDFANQHKTSLIPRTAGTSLAGQCVGKGIVVDVSKHFNAILDFNKTNKTITVQPGVVRDELNNFLKPHGLFFGPNTSTSNRCMIGGMIGNNSSGTTSIKYGVTRDKVLALKTLLSDGSPVTFSNITESEFQDKLKLKNLEGSIYRTLNQELHSERVQEEIRTQFPKETIHRRNTGYAVDEIIKTEPFSGSDIPLNLCKLLSGSEGTLAFTTAITLKLDSLPPENSIMVAAHFSSIDDCLTTVQPVMQHDLFTCEMMDKTILDLTKHNKTQEANRQFIQGDPVAILMCEVRDANLDTAHAKAIALVETLQSVGLSYANPLLIGEDIDKAMNLRKAGLGLLGNIIGDKKTAPCIEDTAVAIPDLNHYIRDFTAIMDGYQQQAVYYAHAGAGELHLRPILNLKKKADVALFRKITTDVAHLVKKYGGSMSGEHGDGIVRAEFIPLMIGEKNYEIIKQIKKAFDPNNIFNPGKIVDAFPMDESLRYVPGRVEPGIETLLDFSESLGVLREAEKCNGSGDCRKLPEFGGTMCPSYRATRSEKDTTRARANALREFLTQSDEVNKFNHQELVEVFDLCLSCKACASECPSSVNVAALKAEFEYQYQKVNGSSLRAKVFAYNNKLNAIGSTFSGFINFMFSNQVSGFLLKKSLGIAPNRTIPNIYSVSLYNWFKNKEKEDISNNYIKEVYFFVDEFTNYLDTIIGQDAINLLEQLNYKVNILPNKESGRAFLSKGFLEQAKQVANENVRLYKNLLSKETPLIGIEPSAILTFKDEYLKLADDRTNAKIIASNTYLIEEFLQNEIVLGNIRTEQFTSEFKTIKFHGHCHQKALSNQKSTFDVLNLPKNYRVTIIPSGCCGMAGSFGYEKEHYDVSMAIGEQTLFPAVRKSGDEVVIAANGTSCRHQIKDGTGRNAKHPITILKEALL